MAVLATRFEFAVGVALGAACLVAQATTLANNGHVDGFIATGGAVTLDFTANAGDTVWLRAVDTNGDNFQPHLQIFDPSGAGVTGDHTDTVAVVDTLKLTATGRYTVVLSDYLGTHPGNYRVYYTRVPGTSELGALSPDGFRDGALLLGDVDSYSFTANAGDTVWLRAVDTNGDSFQPHLQIFDPSGAGVTGDHTDTVAVVDALKLSAPAATRSSSKTTSAPTPVATASTSPACRAPMNWGCCMTAALPASPSTWAMSTPTPSAPKAARRSR